MSIILVNDNKVYLPDVIKPLGTSHREDGSTKPVISRFKDVTLKSGRKWLVAKMAVAYGQEISPIIGKVLRHAEGDFVEYITKKFNCYKGVKSVILVACKDEQDLDVVVQLTNSNGRWRTKVLPLERMPIILNCQREALVVTELFGNLSSINLYKVFNHFEFLLPKIHCITEVSTNWIKNISIDDDMKDIKSELLKLGESQV